MGFPCHPLLSFGETSTHLLPFLQVESQKIVKQSLMWKISYSANFSIINKATAYESPTVIMCVNLMFL